MMKRSTNSLTYKGSIPDAISEARRQKKLFVVYISGEDETSIHLEQSTWIDENVAEMMQRCCIFLHLIHGNVDASQFSAIYPQKSIPSISAVGLNGVMLWHHEGYISADNLKESIEKAWAALHLQETAAALLTAAHASKKPESASSTSIAPSTEQSSSTSDFSYTSSTQTTQSSRDCQLANSSSLVGQMPSEPSHDEHLKVSDEGCSGLHNPEDKRSDSASTKGKHTLHDASRNKDNLVNLNEGDCPSLSEGKTKLDESCTVDSPESAATTFTDRGVPSELIVEQETQTHAANIDVLPSNSAKSNDIQLNIRVPNGSSLQVKLTKEDSLRAVKNFVDENQGGGADPYDLAVPYPRKIFTEQDMNTTLSELGFASRQALIVVLHRQPTGASRQQSSSSYEVNSNLGTDHLSDNSGGYFGYVRNFLSYMNPFSYFGGNPTSLNSEQPANDGLWQYGPNPSLQNRDALAGASQHQFLPDDRSRSTGGNAGNTGGRPFRSFGGNIHTLRHDDNQGPSSDRNTFWNGNSTQFGGDDK